MKTKFIFCCFLLPLAGMVFWGCPIGKIIYPQIYFSDEFKAYTQFKPGSYWIYVDSLSDEIDSVYLYKDEPSMLLHNDSRHSCDRAQNFMYFNSSFYKDSLTSVCDANDYCGGREVCKLGGINVFFTNNKQYITQLHEIPIGDSIKGITKTYYNAFLDSLTIESNIYYGVRTYSIKDIFPRIPYMSYWAKDVGIIKKHTADNRVWQLIRYHIIK